MKAKAAIRKALDQPWLYNEEEILKLKLKLVELEDRTEQEVLHRRTTLGFSKKSKQSNG